MPLKPSYQTVKVEKDQTHKGITWAILNRPEKRNAISPQLCFDMEDVLMNLETDEDTRVIVLTGAGPAFSAGMDLKEYFRANDNNPDGQFRAYNANRHWQWDILSMMRKPTIAMVNGYCYGGAFTPLVGCDLAIAADEAMFGLSEVNWGILPGGIVSKVAQMTMSHRDALFYSMTGRPFSGKEAAAMKLINMSVPLAKLREETIKICNELIEKPPWALAYTKQAIRAVATMDVPAAAEYLAAKGHALRWIDREKDARNQGIEKFIDKKEYRPGLQTVKVT